VPEKNENRESTRFADLAQIFTAYFADKFIDKSKKKINFFVHYSIFDFKILGFAIFEQKDTFFKKSLKILRIHFFQIGKSFLSEIRRNCEIGIPEYLFSVLPFFFAIF
jgi:hypothetical protein